MSVSIIRGSLEERERKGMKWNDLSNSSTKRLAKQQKLKCMRSFLLFCLSVKREAFNLSLSGSIWTLKMLQCRNKLPSLTGSLCGWERRLETYKRSESSVVRVCACVCVYLCSCMWACTRVCALTFTPTTHNPRGVLVKFV